MPTLLFLHGADASFVTPGDLEFRIGQRLLGGRPDLHIDVPSWRSQTMPPLGPVDFTVPGGQIVEPGEAFIGERLVRGFVDRVSKAAIDTVVGEIGSFLTSKFEKDRSKLLEYAKKQLLGEVLGYQLHRPKVHGFVAAMLREIPADRHPVVVAGLSLGGIVAVDFLADPANAEFTARSGQPARRIVSSVVTVGSQSPILYALGALASIPLPGDRYLPKTDARPFTPWRNVYDPRDLLSFLARPIFTARFGDLAISDHERSSRKSFPESHSAYFEPKPDVTWQQLGEAIDRAEEEATAA